MIKKYLRKNSLLVLILVLAACLRFYHLDQIPPSLDWDETALGYNAYSILKTGRDEYGSFLPLVFKSFGDYKPGLYVYLTVPSVAFLGLNELAVRLPSAIVGIATVWLVYQLILVWLKKKPLALLTALTLAISPWHLQFSRSAWEANVVLFFILAGIYCFLKAEKKKKWLYLSGLSFGAAVLTYQGAKLMVPLVIFGLIISFWKKIKQLPQRSIFSAALILFLISLPILLPMVTGGGGRLQVMSLFSYHRPMEEVNLIAQQGGISSQSLTFKLFHSENLTFLRGILGRYFNYFSGKFLFFEGDWGNQRHAVPYAGVLYYLDLVFLLAGVFYLIQNRFPSKNFIWYWLLVSPLPAALSRDAIQAVRSLNMVLPLVIIISFGFYQIYLWLKVQKRFVLIGGLIILSLAYLWCFVYYLDQYYVHYPLQSSQYWQYGYKQVVNKIYPIKDNYSRIVFTQKYGQPYIYWLFYTQYDPRAYQKQAHLIENPYGDVGQVERIDQIEFRNLYWPSDRGLEKTLFVGNPYELPLNDIDPDQAIILEEIPFLNGQIAFRVVETL